jgi:TRAP-type C4-dicarboxylate transport system permease small subunit
MNIFVILFFGITAYLAYQKNMELIEQGTGAYALLTYYTVLAAVVSVGGILKFFIEL